MSLVEIIILAILQGITEFLPVSSSGHLVVANAVLESMGNAKAPDVLEVNIALHLGTLLSVLIYYRREIARLLTSDRRVVPMLIIGTIPAAIVGVILKLVLPEAITDQIQENPLLAGCLFPVTAAILWAATRFRSEGESDYTTISVRNALLIGLAQAAAILPGISRSGSTIAAGQGVGLRRDAAATFAFLLAIPAIAGAGVLEGLDILKAGKTNTDWYLLLIGAGVSFVVGLVALSILIRFVRAGRLAVFAWYLIPLGIAVVAWQLSGVAP
jgi:undecaprenyl-diphosphatase